MAPRRRRSDLVTPERFPWRPIGHIGSRTPTPGALRAIGRTLTGIGVLPGTPPDRRHRFRHWLMSLTRVHDSLAIAELDVPWWTYSAIDLVETWLRSHRRPIRVFEFGSGASTLWLARRVDEVHTVEHHAGFAARIRPEFAARPNITLHQVEAAASARPVVPSGKPGHGGWTSPSTSRPSASSEDSST